jgi:phosphoribosylaminoimidazolecarboxamide formyltransferase/IMP cyclohydrolase
MIRAAAKNFENVVVIVDLNRYDQVLQELKKNGDVSKATRSVLAVEAFKRTAKYDWIIYDFLEKQKTLEKFPDVLNLTYKKIKDLRYGENPHQKATLYSELTSSDEPSILNVKKISGKELDWNNTLDLDTALEMMKEFKEPFVVILKHTSPCGASCGKDIFDAYVKAYEADSLSAFGGVVGLNRKVDLKVAKKMTEAHFDCIIAIDFDEDAINLLAERKALRILKTDELKNIHSKPRFDIVSILGGIMLQERYRFSEEENFKVVTKNKPNKEQFESLLFGWKIARYVKSNAIVLAKGKTTVGIGVGQTSRVDSAKIAIKKAGERAKDSVMVSDGFFPFRDSIDEAAKAGIAAIIQPGGSIKDKEIIDAANEHGIAMVLTGMRCFRH